MRFQVLFQKAMKDVITYDMPREGGNDLVSVDLRMGQPNWGNAQLSKHEYIVGAS